MKSNKEIFFGAEAEKKSSRKCELCFPEVAEDAVSTDTDSDESEMSGEMEEYDEEADEAVEERPYPDSPHSTLEHFIL